MWSFKVNIAVVFATLAPLYYISYRVHHEFAQGFGSSRQNLTHEKYQQLWLSTRLMEPFNASAISEYCSETKWRPKLVFNLPNAVGGIGNVRTNILDWLFFAMDAGASIIIPGVYERDNDDLQNLWAGRQEFDFYFDAQWFREAIQQSCPQMHVYDSIESLEGLATTIEEVYFPAAPFSRRHLSREAWREQTDLWLDAHKVDEKELTIVSVERTMWETDVHKLPAAFRLAFPMLLRSNPSIRRYAAIAMSNLSLDYGLDVSPSLEIPQNAFYGAHLRTEADSVQAGWSSIPYGDWAGQTDAYITGALNAGLSIIYAASGSADDLERFKTKAAANDPPISVVTKHDLLPQAEVNTLSALHWDQQALVDLEILWRCSVFGGLAPSSFSFSIAISRTAWMELHEFGYVKDPWTVSQTDENIAFANDLNKIVGRNQYNEERCREGCWP